VLIRRSAARWGYDLGRFFFCLFFAYNKYLPYIAAFYFKRLQIFIFFIMKSLLTTLLLINTIFLMAQNGEEAAVRAAIEAESKAFHTNPDRQVFLSSWKLEGDSRLVYQGTEGTNLMTGDGIKAAVAAGQIPPADKAVSEFSNFVVRAGGTVAWATFDQKSTTPDGKLQYTREFRCMEKVNGQWKIVSSSVHAYQP
jgi:hypothetical protein